MLIGRFNNPLPGLVKMVDINTGRERVDVAMLLAFRLIKAVAAGEDNIGRAINAASMSFMRSGANLKFASSSMQS